jgi:hypothetical protein
MRNLNRLRMSFVAVGAPLLLCLCGCEGEKIVDVTGVATHAGKPIPNLVIHLTGTGGTRAGATTDEEGRFKLLHDSGKEGVPAGTYQVWVEIVHGSKEDEDGKKQKHAKVDRELSKVLQKYGKNSTAKTVEIKDSQDLQLEFD